MKDELLLAYTKIDQLLAEINKLRYPDAQPAMIETIIEESDKHESHIDHPAHYNTGQIEVIDVIEDWKLGFHLGNAIKYIARAGHKEPDKENEDLEKAIWYIKRHMGITE